MTAYQQLYDGAEGATWFVGSYKHAMEQHGFRVLDIGIKNGREQQRPLVKSNSIGLVSRWTLFAVNGHGYQDNHRPILAQG